MMNRVFSPEPTIDVEDDGQAEPRISPRPSILLLQGRPGGAVSGGTERRRSGSSPPSIVLFSALGGVCMVSALSTMVVLNHWNRAQESLQQERNLLLVERLRQLGPAIPAPVPPHASELHGAGPLSSSAGIGPAASVQEAWIEELDQLPPPPPAEAPLLSVPVSTRLAAPAPVATASPAPAPLATSGSPKAAPTPAAPAPLLVGVVGAPGKASSAIFQYGNVSTSVDVGQVIGSSGWVLRAADGDTAVIERAGESRRISIGNGG
jgi:hypothetical protein